MNKEDAAQYLVNLMAIMEGKEAAGRSRGNTLAREYEKVYGEFVDQLRKEQESETRNS